MMATESHEVVEIFYDYLWAQSEMHSLIVTETYTDEDSTKPNNFWRNQIYKITNFVIRNASTIPNPTAKANGEPYEYSSRKAFFLYQYRENLWKNLQEIIYKVVWSTLTSPVYTEKDKAIMFEFTLQFGRSKSIERYSHADDDDDAYEDVNILEELFSPLEQFDLGELNVLHLNLLEKDFCDLVRDQIPVSDQLANTDTWVINGNN